MTIVCARILNYQAITQILLALLDGGKRNWFVMDRMAEVSVGVQFQGLPLRCERTHEDFYTWEQGETDRTKATS